MGERWCSGANPPVEQLLLDAGQNQGEERLDEPRNEEIIGHMLADFVNHLSDRGICALILILAVCVLVFTGGRR